MYTIQYIDVSGEHRMQSFDSKSRYKLARHLRKFKRPIVAVYEAATPITKAMRAEMAQVRTLGHMTTEAKNFMEAG